MVVLRRIPMEYITLDNGVKMPQEGYGVFQIPSEELTIWICT